MSFYKIREVAAGYPQYLFFRGKDHVVDPVWSPEVCAVFDGMRPEGTLSIPVVDNYATSLRGPPKGSVHPRKVLDNMQQPGLLTPGGNYNLYAADFFRWDIGQPRMHGALFKCPVGETSLGPEFVPIPKTLVNLFTKRTMTDGSFFHMGPTLDEVFDIPSEINFAKYLLTDMIWQYLSLDLGKPIKNVVFESFGDHDRALGYLIESMKNGKASGFGVHVDNQHALNYPKDLRVMVDGKSYLIKGTAEELLKKAIEILPDLETLKEGVDYEADERLDNPVIIAEAQSVAAAQSTTDQPENLFLNLPEGKLPERSSKKQPKPRYQVTFMKGDPHHPSIRTEVSRTLATISHGGQPNERSCKITTNKRILEMAYTCPSRDHGLDLDQWVLLRQKVSALFGIKPEDIIEEVTDQYNTDGSANIIQLFRHEDGRIEILAKGGLGGKPLPTEFDAAEWRSSPNYVLMRTADHACDDMGILRDPELPESDGTVERAPAWLTNDRVFFEEIAPRLGDGLDEIIPEMLPKMQDPSYLTDPRYEAEGGGVHLTHEDAKRAQIIREATQARLAKRTWRAISIQGAGAQNK